MSRLNIDECIVYSYNCHHQHKTDYQQNLCHFLKNLTWWLFSQAAFSIVSLSMSIFFNEAVFFYYLCINLIEFSIMFCLLYQIMVFFITSELLGISVLVFYSLQLWSSFLIYSNRVLGNADASTLLQSGIFAWFV